ncbi:chloramphenicol-sensitive protein RarD [Flexibacter flexilis DSM 6793]|uniref:Chloramphenicol-sensitive protein RarD n=1 Tax=Flexibacter flexilis DSM 6793 TaxID=927664 RepID=A0A1I1NKH2_9BACT|nr:EamA family transporter [Flexibacter flexilis]SFC98184.1 chloramphenicol-sensitive protein RarD [Flexibacter flexilis DSM 6793]
MKINRYYLAAIAAFVIWGFIPFPLRAVSDYASSQIMFYRISFALLGTIILLLTLKRKALQSDWQKFRSESGLSRRKLLTVMTTASLLLSFNWLLFIYVVNKVSVQAGSFSYLICPILTSLLGYLVLSEKLLRNQWLAISLSAVSCSLVASGSFLGMVMSLLVATSYAFYLIAQRKFQGYDKIVLLGVQLSISFLVIAPWYWLTLPAGGAMLPDGHFLTQTLILGVIFTILPLFLNLFALKELSSGTVGILMYINPLINFTMAFLYFGEMASPQQVVAYVLIFLSIVVYNWHLVSAGRKSVAVAAEIK